MDELQERLARTGLAALAEFGFALAGGYALQAHHLVDRMSEDIDLFTDRWDKAEFGRAVAAVIEAYGREGLEVSVPRQADTFARIQVTDPEAGQTAAVDLGADARRLEPVHLSVGPVLAERDAVASKVATVFSRGEARDYLDLAGILESGRFSRTELMRMAAESDPGFTIGWFAEALAGVDRFADQRFAEYGVDTERVARVKETMRDWSRELREGVSRDESRQATPGVEGPSQGPEVDPARARRSRPFPSRWTSGPSGGHQGPSPGPEMGF